MSVISDEINECISLPHPFCSEQGPKKYNDIGIQISTWKIRKKGKKGLVRLHSWELGI